MPLVRPQAIVAYRESHQQVAQSEAAVTLAEQDLIVRVANAYFDVLTAQESLAAADAEVKATEEQQALARRSFAKGVSSITDVDEATTHAESSRSQRLATQTDLEVKRAELEKITGITPAELAPLRPDAQILPPDPQDPGMWVAQAKENHPSVVAFVASVQVARLEVEKARLARLPTLDAVASYGRNYSSGNNINPIDYATNAHIRQAGVQLTLPILDGGGLHAQVGEARARQHRAEADLEGARRQAAVDARSAYEAVVNGIAQIKALRAAIDASVNSVKGNLAGYKLGLRINSDVLEAERERYAAQRELAKARYDALLQGLKLKAATGTLGVADVRAVNEMLVALPEP
jgi:outer membrane protein